MYGCKGTLPSNTIRGEIPRHEISTVFVENSNNKATMEDVYFNNNIILSGQSTSYGATNSFKLTKSYHFIRNLVLHLRIPISGIPQFYNDYVAHSCIDNIKFQIDSTELLQISGYALVDILNEQCENQEQKNKFLELSGYKDIGYGMTFNSTSQYVDLYVPLELPLCSVKPGSFHSQKPYPLYLVPGHCELLIQMRNANDICAVPANIGTGFSSLELLVNYGKIGKLIA